MVEGLQKNPDGSWRAFHTPWIGSSGGGSGNECWTTAMRRLWQILSDPDFEWVRVKMWARPKPLFEALALRAMGRTEEASRMFDEARRAVGGRGGGFSG